MNFVINHSVMYNYLLCQFEQLNIYLTKEFMKRKVYILRNEENEYIVDRMCEQYEFLEKIPAMDLTLTSKLLHQMAEKSVEEYFYVIKTYKELVFHENSFSYEPDSSKYVYIWNNDVSVRMLHTDSVLENPLDYNDLSLGAGSVKLHNVKDNIYSYPAFDIIFLSYDESYADENFASLKLRFPRAKRLHNIKGIYEAHRSAAEWAAYDKSDMLYVVDADAIIDREFMFDYQPTSMDRQSVHVWHSRNPINDLEYGYGGVKLFPTKKLLDYKGSPVDFTTSVSSSFKVMPEVSNITRFNTDPFSAWRSGFRECAKLASKIITNQYDDETNKRLEVWCTVGGDREFGDFAILGANEGRAFGEAYKNQPDMLRLINDFSWLEEKFNS